jgi:aspartyl/asparaginyl beta-hydroxylase (cupin superfamily)
MRKLLIISFTCIILALTISFIFNTPRNLRFFNVHDVCPELTSIHQKRPVILSEVNSILSDPKNWEYWPEKNLYDGRHGSNWKIFPYYAFGIWIQDNCNKTPELTKFIKSIPNLKLATLSKLSPGMKLIPHRGWGNHSNHVIRCHYGIIVPKGVQEHPCYIKVDHELRPHKNDEWMVFDDSKTHMAENKSEEDRVVLIIDIARPPHIPKGTSIVGDSKELVEIVNYFSKKHL